MLLKDQRWQDKSPAAFEPFSKAYKSAINTLFDTQKPQIERSIKIKDKLATSAEHFLRVELEREVYENIVEQGCFYCSAAGGKFDLPTDH